MQQVSPILLEVATGLWSPGQPRTARQSSCPASRSSDVGFSASGPVNPGGPRHGIWGLTPFLLGLSRPSCLCPGSPLLCAASVPREKLCVLRACLDLPVSLETLPVLGADLGVLLCLHVELRRGAGLRPLLATRWHPGAWPGPVLLGGEGVGHKGWDSQNSRHGLFSLGVPSPLE